MISGFRCSVNEIFTLPRFYTAHSGGLLQMFRENRPVPSSSVKPTQSISNELPIYASYNPARAKISLFDFIFLIAVNKH